MIEVQDLKKDFGHVRALRGVSFEVGQGQVVGLLGPNGAGKSTAMRIITGFLGQTSGSARVNGMEVRDNRVATQALIGYLPEGNPLYTELRLIESRRFVAEMHGLRGADRDRAIAKAVDAAGLRGMERRTIGTFSKGFRQRVGVAQALVHEPPVLILDEPTSGLDPLQQDDMIALIESLSGERTVVFSTHVLPKVEAVCSRAIVIHQGRKVADGSVDEIRGQPTIEVEVQDGTTAKATFEALPFVTGATTRPAPGGRSRVSLAIDGAPDDSMLGAVATKTTEAQLGLSVLEFGRPSLHDAFVRLIESDEPGAVPESDEPDAPAVAAADDESGEDA